MPYRRRRQLPLFFLRTYPRLLSFLASLMRSWLRNIPIYSIKVCDQPLGVFNIFDRFPDILGVYKSFLFDQIVWSVADDSHIQNLFDVITRYLELWVYAGYVCL
jgi:hypothetical protein